MRHLTAAALAIVCSATLLAVSNRAATQELLNTIASEELQVESLDVDEEVAHGR